MTGRISLSFKNKSNKSGGAAAASSTSGDANNVPIGIGSRTTTMVVNGGTLESIVALESADQSTTTATASDVTTSLTVPVDAGEHKFYFFLHLDLDEWPNS